MDLPENVKRRLLADDVEKRIEITFPNRDHSTITSDQIQQEQFSLKESCCSQKVLKFGLCEASRAEFSVHGLEHTIRGSDIDITEAVLMEDGSWYAIPLGRYNVAACKKQTNMDERKIEAYDRLNGNELDGRAKSTPTGYDVSTFCRWLLALTQTAGLDLEGVVVNHWRDDPITVYTPAGEPQPLDIMVYGCVCYPQRYVGASSVPVRTPYILERPTGEYSIGTPRSSEHIVAYPLHAPADGNMLLAVPTYDRTQLNALCSDLAAVGAKIGTAKTVTASTLITQHRPGISTWACHEMKFRDGSVLVTCQSVPVNRDAEESLVAPAFRWIPSALMAEGTPIYHADETTPINFYESGVGFAVAPYAQAWAYGANSDTRLEFYHGRPRRIITGFYSLEVTDAPAWLINPLSSAQVTYLRQYCRQEECTFRDVLQAAFELQGVFAAVEGDRLVVRHLDADYFVPETDTIVTSDYIPNASFDTYIPAEQIEEAWYDEEEITPYYAGVRYIDDRDKDNPVEIAYTGNPEGSAYYDLSKNLLIKALREAGQIRSAEIRSICERLYCQISDIHWVPVEATFRARPWLHAGDRVQLNDNGRVVQSYIFEKNTSGITGMMDEIASSGVGQ